MTTQLSADQTHDVRLDILVDPESWVGLYDHIEVHRSVLGEAGPYAELTGATWAPALLPPVSTVPGGNGPSTNIVGKKLELLVGATPVEVTFTGVDPLTYAQAAAQIAATMLLGAYVAGGKLVLQSITVGAAARLEVVGGDAAALLALPLAAPESIAYGSDPRIPLIDGRKTYSFRDYYGKKTYFYKTRLVNRLSGARSDFSEPISAVPQGGLTADHLVTGYVVLVRGDGRPDVKQEVTVYSSSLGQQVAGVTLTGGQRAVLTDDYGRAEFRLVRGAQIDVGISGMNLMRRITVPADPSIESFDLLSPEYGVDDAFVVKRLDIPTAEKRNL